MCNVSFTLFSLDSLVGSVPIVYRSPLLLTSFVLLLYIQMKNAGEETLTFALLLYYSFHFWFDAIKTEQQPIESCQTPPPQLSSLHSQKLCSLSPSLAPSAQRRLLRYSTPPAQSLLVALHLALLTLYYCLSHL